MLFRSEIEENGIGAVPTHLMDANRDAKGFGHGKGYQYPHMFPDHFTPQQYLPTELLGKEFYKPSEQGYEKSISERVSRWRKAQAQALGNEPPPEPKVK